MNQNIASELISFFSITPTIVSARDVARKAAN
jgi:hypothetical protein